jgi:hypothetical protein
MREHCDKIILWDRPGAKARRGKRILEADWRPFHHLTRVESDVACGIFVGFSFLDGTMRLDVARGIYPTKDTRVSFYLGSRF